MKVKDILAIIEQNEEYKKKELNDISISQKHEIWLKF